MREPIALWAVEGVPIAHPFVSPRESDHRFVPCPQVGLDKKVVVLSDLRPDSADRQDSAAASNPGAEGEQEEDREAVLKLTIGDEQADKVLKLEASLKDIAKSDPAAKDLAVILSPETDKVCPGRITTTLPPPLHLLRLEERNMHMVWSVRLP